MGSYVFTLQLELGRREEEEHLARDAYLDARAERLEAEATLIALRERRWRLTAEVSRDVPRGLALEGEILQLDDEERTQWAALVGLEDEERHALEAWRAKRLQADLLARLREAERDMYEALPRAA
jgi:hypothetical protein